MDKITERITKLSPEKRALLLKKLKTHQQQEEGDLLPPRAGGKSSFTLAEDENLRCKIATPGNLGNLSFQKVPRIPPAPDQVQIKAKAVGINFRDLMIALGIYPPTPNMPSNMGTDYVGIVVAVGQEVDQFKPGDEVIALTGRHLTPDDHFSVYINVFPVEVVTKPANMNFEEAAGVPTVFLTTYYALHHQACLAKGERVLIHSATGGVGLAAIQVARWCGAEILATASTPEKREHLKSMGINHPMDSRSLDFARQVMEITNGEGVDVILNSLAGAAVQKGLEILKPFGRFLEIDKREIYLDSSLKLGCFNKGLTFTAVDLGLFLSHPPRLKSLLLELVDHFSAGTFKPLPHRTFPVLKSGDALTYMSKAQHIGKIVLSYPWELHLPGR